MPNLTAEQSAILAAARDTNLPLVIDAKAGSGKTYTLVELIRVLNGTISIQAFNKSIAQELTARIDKMGLPFARALEVSASTVHSHGLSAFRKSGHKPNTQSGKLNFMLKDMMQVEYEPDDPMWRNMGKVTRLVGYAKAAGFGLQSEYEEFPSLSNKFDWMMLAEHYMLEEELTGGTTIDEVCMLGIRLLKASNSRPNFIDFDDMIYLPLLLDMNIPQYDNVLLDEAQDINATRREMAFRSVKPGGRLIAVGDPNQAIYGFTGADTESLNNIVKRSGAKVYPLSICWRCDEEIIKEAQVQVPGIQARPGAPAGRVDYIDFALDNFLEMLVPGDAVLCRLNKPNVAVALGLLRRGQRPRIEGRDLGKRLLYHVQRADDLYTHHKVADFLPDLENYRDQEVAKLTLKQRESAAALLADEVDATILLCERTIETQGASAGYSELEKLVESLFGENVSRSDTITLSSIHKAKGREWPRVYILGYDDWMPFSMARADWEKVQEQNLIYVAKTRAEKHLIFVNGAKAAIEAGVHKAKAKPVEEIELLPVPEGIVETAKMLDDLKKDMSKIVGLPLAKPEIKIITPDHLVNLMLGAKK